MKSRLRSAGTFLEKHWILTAFFALSAVFVMIPGNIERMFVYFPSRELASDPSRAGLQYEDISPVAEDGVRLHGWYVPYPQSRCTLLIFHGNAGNIGHRVEWVEMLHELRASVLILDYRGYGRSEGRPYEAGLYRDAMAAYGWWRQRSGDRDRLIAIGESLGGAVAVNLASRVEIDGLVLQSTFTSAWDMAKTLFPIGLLQPLARIRFDSASVIGKISCPKLIIHGEADEIVPFRLGRKLHDLAAPPKEFYAVPRAHHNDLLWVAGPEYGARMSSFIGRVCGGP
jgi:fermentation-respiration switch protein FrsA (DUF1100 family)